MRYLAAALILACAGNARADVWLGAEAPFAFAASDTQRGLFDPGFLPAAGVYAGGHRAALGLRVRAGFLADSNAPASDGREDPGTAGLVSTTLAGRVRVADGWLELAAGGGITGRALAPTVELAAGWTFARTSIEVGPCARYVRVVSTDAMDAFGSADLVLVGLDVRFGRSSSPRPIRTAPVERVAAPVVVPVEVVRPEPIQADPVALVDVDASCMEDSAGCAPEGMEVHEDRIILDERVLFDFERARVRHAGRKLVREVVEMWKAHPGWVRITIEGHTDVRGSDDYNLRLSEERARRVRDVMLHFGAPDAIDVVGVGRARPRDPGHSEAAHSRNRRVEFVIERRLP
jgi:outer membrane protein OmpA-like peptidoglycan-associated protein